MHAHEVVVDPVIVHPIFRFPFAVGHGTHRGARLFLACGEDALDRGINRLGAVFLVELADARDAGAQTRDLGVEVAHHRFRCARIDADDAQQFLVRFTPTNDLLAGNHDPSWCTVVELRI